MVNKKAENEKYKVIHSFGSTVDQAEKLDTWLKEEKISKSGLIRKKLFGGN